jgi:hypothetical protein
MKTSGFNFQDLEEENKKVDEFLDMGDSIDMKMYQPKKKKVKFNFDHLFPAPKNNEAMGMSNIAPRGKKPFEGVI